VFSLWYGLNSRLGGVMASVLATGPKSNGFQPGQSDGFLRAIKIRSTPSFGWEVKPEVQYRMILRHVKHLLKSHGDGQTKFSFPSHILLPAPEMSLLTGLLDCQGTLVDELGVSPSRHYHSMIHLAITRGRTTGPQSPQFWDVSLTPSYTMRQWTEF
jgi:hypothetical protein